MASKDQEEAWTIPEVYLLTTGADGRVAIPALTLTLSDAGIALAKSDGEVVWHCTWTHLDEMSTSERSIMDDATEGIVVVMVEHGGRQHRFIFPATDPEATQARVRQWATAHRVRTFEPPQAVSRTLTVAVVMATLATLSVLLLSAAHVLHL